MHADAASIIEATASEQTFAKALNLDPAAALVDQPHIVEEGEAAQGGTTQEKLGTWDFQKKQQELERAQKMQKYSGPDKWNDAGEEDEDTGEDTDGEHTEEEESVVVSALSPKEQKAAAKKAAKEAKKSAKAEKKLAAAEAKRQAAVAGPKAMAKLEVVDKKDLLVPSANSRTVTVQRMPNAK